MKKPAFKGIVGKTVVVKLDSVAPNNWNPNRMLEHKYASMCESLRTDGWFNSDAMLVWGTDEKGREQNIIINGEHRWKGAREIGMKEGPAVFIHGVTRAQAIKLTIKLDNNRGSFEHDLLVKALREVAADEPTDLGPELGFSDEQLMQLLAEPTVSIPGQGGDSGGEPPRGPGVVHSENPHVKMVPMFFSPEQHAVFEEQMRVLSGRFKTENVTDTIIAALAEVAPLKAKKKS